MCINFHGEGACAANGQDGDLHLALRVVGDGGAAAEGDGYRTSSILGLCAHGGGCIVGEGHAGGATQLVFRAGDHHLVQHQLRAADFVLHHHFDGGGDMLERDGAGCGRLVRHHGEGYHLTATAVIAAAVTGGHGDGGVGAAGLVDGATGVVAIVGRRGCCGFAAFAGGDVCRATIDEDGILFVIDGHLVAIDPLHGVAVDGGLAAVAVGEALGGELDGSLGDAVDFLFLAGGEEHRAAEEYCC